MKPTDLRAIRKSLGLTQATFAELLRLDGGSRTIRKYESGERPISGPVSLAAEALADGWMPRRPSS